jgi:GTP cyclohydrolase I
MNRIVEYYSKDRTRALDNANRSELQNALGTKDVACVIDAKHLCVIQEESVILKVALSL